MRIELDTKANALYLQLVDEIRDGEAVHTIQIEEDVYLDLDKDRRPLGLEFLNAGDFQGFLRRCGGAVEITKDGFEAIPRWEQPEAVVTAEDEQEEEVQRPAFGRDIGKHIAFEEGREPARRRRGREVGRGHSST